MAARKGARSLADLVPGCVGPLAAARGFAATELIARWREIAGEEIGLRSRPMRLAWPPRGEASDPDTPVSAVLHVRVDGAFAMSLQFESAALIERINAHLGWRCVSALRMRQGPVSAGRPARPALAAPTPEQQRQIEHAVAAADPVIAPALKRLGEAVLARRRS